GVGEHEHEVAVRILGPRLPGAHAQVEIADLGAAQQREVHRRAERRNVLALREQLDAPATVVREPPRGAVGELERVEVRRGRPLDAGDPYAARGTAAGREHCERRAQPTGRPAHAPTAPRPALLVVSPRAFTVSSTNHWLKNSMPISGGAAGTLIAITA